MNTWAVVKRPMHVLVWRQAKVSACLINKMHHALVIPSKDSAERQIWCVMLASVYCIAIIIIMQVLACIGDGNKDSGDVISNDLSSYKF